MRIKAAVVLTAAGLLAASSALSQPSSISLEQQARCGAQGEKLFAKFGWDAQRDTVQSHVNTKLNRCFVEIIGHNPPTTTSKILLDAYEQREYATYIWIPKNGRKYWEVPPVECTLKPLGAAERKCASDQEYQDFVRPYLED